VNISDVFDDDPEVVRVQLSCDHVADPMSLTDCCKVQLLNVSVVILLHVILEHSQYLKLSKPISGRGVVSPGLFMVHLQFFCDVQNVGKTKYPIKIFTSMYFRNKVYCHINAMM